MRRRIGSFAVAGALAFAPAAHAINPQMAGLQVALRAYGLYGGRIDAIAGPMTTRAVRTFQRRSGLRITGVADGRTRAAMGPLGRPLFGSRTIRAGAFGWDVSVLQFLLARRGFRPGLIGGYFNGQTRRALERYQRSVRLRADGIAGRATIAALSFQARVPVRNEPARTYYVVRRGDTLTSIAERFHVTVRALAAANRLDPKAVLPAGRRLVIPGGSSRLIVAAPWTIRALIDYWSHRYRVDPHLVRAVAWMESGYQTTVVSSSGAVGVMQILPSTRRYVETVLIGHRVRDDASGNIQVGVVYLRHLLRRFNGRRRLALAAWHEGPAALRRHGIFPETRRFVAAVLALSRRM